MLLCWRSEVHYFLAKTFRRYLAVAFLNLNADRLPEISFSGHEG